MSGSSSRGLGCDLVGAVARPACGVGDDDGEFGVAELLHQLDDVFVAREVDENLGQADVV